MLASRRRVRVQGVLYIVSGLGGAELHRLSDEAVEGSEFRYNRNHGALLVTAGKKKGEGMHIQFFTHEVKMHLANRAHAFSTCDSPNGSPLRVEYSPR